MALDSHIYTILEPSIKLEPMQTPNIGERATGDGISDTQGGAAPYIKINEYVFTQGDIEDFTLDLNGKYPEIRARISDRQGLLSVDKFPRDGDILSLRIQLDEAGTYKDIRMDFNILEFKGFPTNATEITNGSGSVYRVRAIARIPGMYTDECKSYGENTSLEHIKLIAQDLQLGLATNIGATDDKMRRFCAYQSKLELISDTVLHSYVSDNAFQTYSIDPYYYINYVDLQTVFNAPNDIEIHEMISAKVFNERGTDPKEGAGKSDVQLILSNHHLVNGTNQYIESYNLLNNATQVALENGYKRKMQFFDLANTNTLVEFDVESLVSSTIADNEEPLKGRRNNDNDEWASHYKQKYVGIQSDATHLNYNFAAVNNIQNMVELDKLQLEVELAVANPALYKYMKVPVTIYNYKISTAALQDDQNKKAIEDGFTTKESELQAESVKQDDDYSTFTLDEFLSGHYVIIGIQYKYNQDDQYRQVLKLARREWPAQMGNM